MEALKIVQRKTHDVKLARLHGLKPTLLGRYDRRRAEVPVFVPPISLSIRQARPVVNDAPGQHV